MSNDDIFGKRFVGPQNSIVTEQDTEKVFGKRFQPPKPVCNPEPVRSRMQPSGPQIFFVTVQSPGPNGQADVLVQLPFPCNSFFIVNRKSGTENTTIFFHLAKLGKSYSTANVASTATGLEQWISMNALPASGPVYLTVIRFKEKILQYFLDIGNEGGPGPITIANVADESMRLTGGLYT